jgi:transposase-like protein
MEESLVSTAPKSGIRIITCPSCGSHMRLSTVTPAAANQQRVKFACTCGYTYEQTDPITAERAL